MADGDDGKKSYGYSDAFAIFEKPIYETGTVESRFVPYSPCNQISEEGPIDFIVSIIISHQSKHILAKIVTISTTPRRHQY